MTRLTYTNEETSQANLHTEAEASSEAGQILHLKRLLVTLKQHYEKCLYTAQMELQSEQNQRLVIQQELENKKMQLEEIQAHHEDELQALRDQQIALKDRIRKLQEEDPSSIENDDQAEGRRSFEQEERAIPCMSEQSAEATVEMAQLREDFERAHQKIKAIEQELVENKVKAQQEIERLQQIIEAQRNQDDHIETVVSQTSSHHLRQELEAIKRTLTQGAQDSKAMEVRYVELLNEKVGLEHQCKQLQLQFEHQSSNLSSFQMQLHAVEQEKRDLEVVLNDKEERLTESDKQLEEVGKKIQLLDELVREKEFIQEKYEQLKDEWVQLTERLDEALDARTNAERRVVELETIVKEQESQFQDGGDRLKHVVQEQEALANERDQLRGYLEDSESRLKVAQQHLAKKVKETALLNERVAEQQNNLNDFTQVMETQKNQIAQFQSNLDFYQKQEKHLQEQLHDALKGTESQVAKWEEKYFRMYDKWQESENLIRELRKFEEKHHQMQSLLANLGNFMGASNNSSNAFTPSGQDGGEHLGRSLGFEMPIIEGVIDPAVELAASVVSKGEVFEEKFDLFGMRQPLDRPKPPTTL